MSDQPPPPRVRVTLPTGATVEARLLGWQQADDGTWRAEVALTVPAGAVARVDGEDYSQVPRVPAEPRYVLDNSLPPGRDGPRLVLHRADVQCWDLGSVRLGTRITPVPDAATARAMLKTMSAAACDVCHPEP